MSLLKKIVNEENVMEILEDLYSICKISSGKILDDIVLTTCTISSKYPATIERTYENVFNLLQMEDQKVFDSVFKGIHPILKNVSQIFDELIPHLININPSLLSDKSVLVYLWIIGEYGCNSDMSIEIIENFIKEYDTKSSRIKNELLSVCTKLFIANPVQTKPILLKLIDYGNRDISPFVRNHTIFVANLIKSGIDNTKKILCEKFDEDREPEDTIQELIRKDEMLEDFDINNIFCESTKE